MDSLIFMVVLVLLFCLGLLMPTIILDIYKELKLFTEEKKQEKINKSLNN